MQDANTHNVFIPKAKEIAKDNWSQLNRVPQFIYVTSVLIIKAFTECVTPHLHCLICVLFFAMASKITYHETILWLGAKILRIHNGACSLTADLVSLYPIQLMIEFQCKRCYESHPKTNNRIM